MIRAPLLAAAALAPLLALATPVLGQGPLPPSAPPPAPAAAAAPDPAAPIKARLTGTAEVPPADGDGTGSFTARLNDTHDELCYELKVDSIDQARAAHIHAGAAGVNGPPVVTLQAPANGVANACAAVTAEIAIKLMQHPEAYYVNVHNAAYPAGAVRGQLGR